MSVPNIPDISDIRAAYPDRVVRKTLPGGFDGPVQYYREPVDGREAWAMYRTVAAGDIDRNVSTPDEEML